MHIHFEWLVKDRFSQSVAFFWSCSSLVMPPPSYFHVKFILYFTLHFVIAFLSSLKLQCFSGVLLVLLCCVISIVMATSVYQDVCLFNTSWLNSLVCATSCRRVTAIIIVVIVQFLRFVRQIGEGSVTVEDRAGKQLADKAQAREAQNWASSFTQVRALSKLIKRACAACSHSSSCCLVWIKAIRRSPLPCASVTSNIFLWFLSNKCSLLLKIHWHATFRSYYCNMCFVCLASFWPIYLNPYLNITPQWTQYHTHNTPVPPTCPHNGCTVPEGIRGRDCTSGNSRVQREEWPS